jgi:surface antigen Omp85-like protein
MSARLATAALLVALSAAGLRAAVASPAASPPAFAGVVPHAEPAPADTALERFLGSMSDSTAVYFGATAAHTDTAGLDSALAFGLAHPGKHDYAKFPLSFNADLGFSRVDGPVYGGSVSIGRAYRLGKLEGLVDWASGPNDVLGGATFRRTSRLGEAAAWSLKLFAGRRTDGMDRDTEDIQLAMLRAFFSGTDYKHYLRRDGFEGSIARETGTWRAKAAYRDMLESPIATSATWNLFNAEPVVIGNLPAVRGRNREFTLEAGLRTPGIPVRAEIGYSSSSGATSSDFEYRRTRAALAGDFGLARRIAIVPQLAYGRLTGDAPPQASFYLGGTNSSRGFLGATRGGTGQALARLDVIGADDILTLAHLPHPAWLPIQVGAFASAGATWGADPYDGSTRGGVDWPDQEHWVSEAGGALLWRPGIPDPAGFFRFSYAWPLGPARESARFTATYSRAVALVKSIGE